jgi:hypothetical protein
MKRRWLLIGLPILAIAPLLIINIIISVPRVDFISGSVDTWIGFFGSYFGGIVGSLAAFGIAYYQVQFQAKQSKEQFAQQKDVEVKTKLYNQLPYLVHLKYIVQQISDGLKHADDIINEKIPEANGKGNMKFDFRIPYQPEFVLESEHFSLLHNIVDDHIHTTLLKLFYFYKDYYEAVSFDTTMTVQEIRKLEKILFELNKNYKNNKDEIEERDVIKQGLMNNFQFSMIKKQVMWDKLKNSNYYSFSKEVLSILHDETERLKDIFNS